jgi:hypothetical protein
MVAPKTATLPYASVHQKYDTDGKVNFYARSANEFTLRMSSVLDFATSITGEHRLLVMK